MTPGRDERSSRAATTQNLLHRLALRRVRQVGYPAAAQPGRAQGGRRPPASSAPWSTRPSPGLAQGREIEGNVRVSGRAADLLARAAQARSTRRLNVTGDCCPENCALFRGAGRGHVSRRARQHFDLAAHDARQLRNTIAASGDYTLPSAVCERGGIRRIHRAATRATQCRARATLASTRQRAYLGIDAGSTTVKAGARLPRTKNCSVPITAPTAATRWRSCGSICSEIYRALPRRAHRGQLPSTGYGEELIKNAFRVDHRHGGDDRPLHGRAKHFMPGRGFHHRHRRAGHQVLPDPQRRHRQHLPERGLFLRLRLVPRRPLPARMGYAIAEFAKAGAVCRRARWIWARRCTVFMNSSVKQAQKDGATMEDISAGLVHQRGQKRALQGHPRRIPPRNWGSTSWCRAAPSYNDAVLRAFEQEIGRDVIRPDIAGLMGAYGAALYAMAHSAERSGLLIARKSWRTLPTRARPPSASGCTNHCRLTINTFADGRTVHLRQPVRSAPLARKARAGGAAESLRHTSATPARRIPAAERPRQNIGLPMALNMYELLPFWHALLHRAGLRGGASPPCPTGDSTSWGSITIPSDTACYPGEADARPCAGAAGRRAWTRFSIPA